MPGRNSSAEVTPYHAEDYDKGECRDAHAELYAGGLKDEFHTMTACRDFKCSKHVVSPQYVAALLIHVSFPAGVENLA